MGERRRNWNRLARVGSGWLVPRAGLRIAVRDAWCGRTKRTRGTDGTGWVRRVSTGICSDCGSAVTGTLVHACSRLFTLRGGQFFLRGGRNGRKRRKGGGRRGGGKVLENKYPAMQIGRQADCQSAIRQAASLRYDGRGGGKNNGIRAGEELWWLNLTVGQNRGCVRIMTDSLGCDLKRTGGGQ